MAQRYSPERKAALLAKLLPPHNLSVITVSRQEGIGKTTLYKCLAEIRREENDMPGKGILSHKWSAEDRFAVVVEKTTLSEEDMAAYCRHEDLFLRK